MLNKNQFNFGMWNRQSPKYNQEIYDPLRYVIYALSRKDQMYRDLSIIINLLKIMINIEKGYSNPNIISISGSGTGSVNVHGTLSSIEITVLSDTGDGAGSGTGSVNVHGSVSSIEITVLSDTGDGAGSGAGLEKRLPIIS